MNKNYQRTHTILCTNKNQNTSIWVHTINIVKMEHLGFEQIFHFFNFSFYQNKFLSQEVLSIKTWIGLIKLLCYFVPWTLIMGISIQSRFIANILILVLVFLSIKGKFNFKHWSTFYGKKYKKNYFKWNLEVERGVICEKFLCTFGNLLTLIVIELITYIWHTVKNINMCINTSEDYLLFQSIQCQNSIQNKILFSTTFLTVSTYFEKCAWIDSRVIVLIGTTAFSFLERQMVQNNRSVAK